MPWGWEGLGGYVKALLVLFFKMKAGNELFVK